MIEEGGGPAPGRPKRAAPPRGDDAAGV